MSWKFIRRRKEKAFESLRARRKIMNQPGVACGIKKIARAHELSRFEFVGDVKHRFAFAHRERLLVDLAVRELPEDLLAGHGTIEKVFPGLQGALRMPPCINLKRRRAAHHAICSQQIRHMPL